MQRGEVLTVTLTPPCIGLTLVDLAYAESCTFLGIFFFFFLPALLRPLGRDRYYAYHGTSRYTHHTYTSEYREQGILTIFILVNIASKVYLLYL